MASQLPFTLLIFLYIQNISFGQTGAIKFYEIIKDDSIALFFNERNIFTEKECLEFVRYTKVDDEGNFHGYYEDLDKTNTLISRGYYIHGKKDGYFELYHTNGNIKCRGNYQNHTPTGNWEYFYEQGGPERTLAITETDTLLLSYTDPKGNLLVVNGNVDFHGLVAGNSTSKKSIIALGKVENGKPAGNWHSPSLVTNTIYTTKPLFKES